MNGLTFRSVLETGADAGELLVGVESHNQGLCLRVHEQQAAGRGKWMKGRFDLIYEGEGHCAGLLQAAVGRMLEAGSFLDAFQKRSHDPVIDLKTLTRLEEVRIVLVRLLTARPFLPFKLRLSGGHCVNVEAPKLVLLDRQTMVLGQPDANLPPPAVGSYSLLSMIHIRELDYYADEAITLPTAPTQDRSEKGHNK